MKITGLEPERLLKRITLWLALAGALLWGWILPQIPVFQEWELATGDFLVRLFPAVPATDVVVILFNRQNPLVDRLTYSQQVEQILEGGAQGVILNLPQDFDTPLKPRGRLALTLPGACFTPLETDLDCPLRRVVGKNHPRIILVTEASSRIEIYNHFQSLTEDGERYRYPLEQVLAVPGMKSDGDGVLRRLPDRMPYTDSDNSGPWTLAPVATLAAQKWGGVKNSLEAQGVRMAPVGTVALRQIGELCPGEAPCQGVKNKIVILGPVTPGRSTVFGVMNPLEIQAQMLTGVLRQDFYQRPLPLAAGVMILIVVLIWFLLLLAFAPPDQALPVWWQWLLVGGAGMVGWLGFASLSFGVTEVLLPTFLTVGAILTTTGTTYSYEAFSHARQTLLAQQQELERLRRAERQAILNQARKLLYRVATDIHDQELQQLKLVMDDLERLMLKPDPQAVDLILDQLQEIGRGIRDELGNIRTLADKLEISPELKQGLHQGISAQLEEAKAKGDLLVRLETELEPLKEPLDQSQWLDAREDIFRFFREALTNAIRHSQPPRGTSTYLKVSLKHHEHGALLIVENDGAAHVQTFGERNPGYGTKAMNTISHSLPGGTWKREILAGGRVRVTLSWDMQSWN